MNPTALDVQDWPKIQIGDKEIEIRLTYGAYRRAQQIIKARERADGEPLPGADQAFVLLSVGIAHDSDKTPDELADMFTFSEVAYVNEKVTEALKKVSTQAAKPAAEKLWQSQSRVNGSVN